MARVLAMAEIRPLRALHYNLAAVGGLGDVVAPPYDVIDAEMRRALVARSPFSVVEIDLPEAPADADPYEHAAETLEEWTLQGILAGDREPALWALEQHYAGPDGVERTRRGILCRVRVTDYGAGLVRPHERTQPGPKEDRLHLMRATRHNTSPIFSLHEGDAWGAVEGAIAGPPWGEATDADGTVNRVWRIGEPAIHDAVAEALADAELLIADGHHRYETARTYADEVGGDGDHRYTLMSLTSLGDPGLTVFGYHRVLRRLLEGDAVDRLIGTAHRHFDVEEVPLEALDPAGEEGIGVFGYADSQLKRGFRLRLHDAAAIAAALPDRSNAYRDLDAAILEALFLRDALGMTEEDIEAKRGIAYTASTEAAIAALEGEGQAVFLMRPTPVEQVRAVAAAGETMPPKSTYFYPKLPTGLVMNPLS
jgi:uncharacterized protein (DUF1015 family)